MSLNKKSRRSIKKPDEGVKIKEEQLRLTDVIVIEENDQGKRPSSITCNLCQQTFPSSKRMRGHQAKCFIENGSEDVVVPQKSVRLPRKNKTKFSCKPCNKKFKFEESFIMHNTMVHSESPDSIPCTQCSAKCPDQEALELHIDKEHNAKTFSCPGCSATFSRNYHVFRHLEQKGCGGSPAKLFGCKICGSRFSRKDNLMYHLRNNHIPHLKKFQCKQCVFGVDKFPALIRHHTKCHMGKIFICDVCGNTVGSRMAISKHLESHGEKKYVCDICQYRTFTIEVLRRHMNVHRDKKPNKCTLCTATFTQPQQLRKHLSKHFDMRCVTCDMDFKNKAMFHMHMKKHIDAEEMVCPYPGCSNTSAFHSSEDYKRHLDTHNSKEWTCNVCNRNFDKLLHLKRHTLSHTFEKPRRCIYCVSARAYGRGDRLLKHIRMTHTELFIDHWNRVRQANNRGCIDEAMIMKGKLTKEDANGILDILDELQDSLLVKNSNSNASALYHDCDQDAINEPKDSVKSESPLMSEEHLLSSLKTLLVQLIDAPMLEALGFPQEEADEVLAKVLQHCKLQVADRSRWSRVQCLRENLKQLFLRVIDDTAIQRMLEICTIDQVVRHVIAVAP